MAGRGDIEAGKAYVTLYVKNSLLVKGMTAVNKELKALGTNVMKLGGIGTALGSSILAPIGAAVMKVVAFGREVQSVSQQTGIGAAALGEYKFAAEQAGAGLKDIENASKAITKTIADVQMGSSGAAVALSRIGLSAAQLKSMAPEKQLEVVADRVGAIADPALRAAMATQLLGGTSLLPVLGQMSKLREEARRLGVAPTKKAIDDASMLGRMIDKVMSVVNASIMEVGSAAAPVLIQVADAVVNIAGTVNRWVKGNHELIQQVMMVGAKIFAIGGIVMGVGALIFGVGTAFGFVASAVTIATGLVAAFLSPVALVGAAIAAGVAAWLAFSDGGRKSLGYIGGLLGDLSDAIDETFGGIADALKAGDIQLAGQIAVKGLQLAFLTGVNVIAKSIGGVVGGAIGAIGKDLVAGNLAGAWSIAVKSMAAVWDKFTSGIVNAFADAAKAVLGAWTSVSNSVAQTLLHSRLFNMDAEQRRAEETRQRQLRTLPSLRDQALANAARAEAMGGKDEKGETAAMHRAVAADHQAALDKARAETIDVVGEAHRIAAEEIEKTAASVRNVFSEFDPKEFERRAKASLAALTKSLPRVTSNDPQIAQLEEELGALLAQAAAAAEEGRGRNIGVPLGPDGGGNIVHPTALRQNFGTFSAFALAGAGGAERVQAQQLQVQQQQLAVLKGLAANPIFGEAGDAARNILKILRMR